MSIDKTQLTQLFVEFLEKHFGASKEESPKKGVFLKQFKDEEMVAVEAIYIKSGDVDLHGDTISQEELQEVVKQLNAGDVKPDLFHGIPAEAIFKINKAWINPYRCSFSETGEEVPEGQPLVEIQFLNEAAWEMRKQGKLAGLSIGGKAEWEEINE